jgi:hypothetical protein
MPNNWREAYSELTDYIARNPVIEISECIIALPGDVRPEFYRLFDTVRTRFIQENFPASLENSYALAKGYAEISQCVKDTLKLEAINPRPGIKWFLQDPLNGLIRILFDPLFDLLKGKTDQNTFEEVLCRQIGCLITDYMHDGYKRWVALSLVALTAPDKIYRVGAADSTTPDEGNSESVVHQEFVPETEETRNISFNPTPLESFSLPSVLVHSRRLNKHMSIQADFNEARWQAKTVSPSQEWYEISALKEEFGKTELWPDLAVYTAEQPRQLALVADQLQVARPDIILEVRAERGWYRPEEADTIKRHYDILKPRLGTYVICRGPVPEEAVQAISCPPVQPAPEHERGKAPTWRRIFFLSAGFDTCRLELAIETLEKPPDAETKPA